MAVPLIGSREATGESLEINERYVRGSRGNIGTTGRRLFHICPIMVLPQFSKVHFCQTPSTTCFDSLSCLLKVFFINSR